MKTLVRWQACRARVVFRAAVLILLAALTVGLVFAGEARAETRWYKGSTHAHSFWSDGDQFPEMVVDWYKSHGYDFFCLSDHNVLMQGEHWRKLQTKKRPVTEKMLAACQKRFGKDWVELRGEGADREVRLKTFDELKRHFDEPGKFLLIQGEEITGKCGEKQVHVNAINLTKVIQPQKAKTVPETISADVEAVARQSRQTGRTILAHVNHPNWKHYDLSAQDLAYAKNATIFEVCNNSGGVSHNGDETHPSVERLWDIANTIRLTRLKSPPLYGVASDDAHRYHKMTSKAANPGRGWIVVRAEELAVEPLLKAVQRGDFYASTGVVLKDVQYDPAAGTLRVDVDPEPSAKYVIEFIGTTRDVIGWQGSPAADPHTGQVLARHEGTSATYHIEGNELYFRAVVRSDRKLDNPPADGVDHKTAWTQPVGWEKHVGKKQ
ncbi:MAG: hypothetical protein JW818_01750 [Pirellulales bacterium]|nr:hypothetical protein [Pirellulales bacterium]